MVPGGVYVVEPILPLADSNFASKDRKFSRSKKSRFDEAVGLVRALDLEVAGGQIISLRGIRSATLLGSGKVEEIRLILSEGIIDLVFIDTALTPVQQRNLESIWQVKVVDRTGLILEIFASRARSREGRLQVKLAQMEYQKSRLVRSWTHLERQRGGRGFLTGPGETQIESDRRQIQEQIDQIRTQLSAVVRRRFLHRSARKKGSYPLVALVGYTNAGKSSLLNALTGAGAYAKDFLFATLDPKARRLVLPSGLSVILSDTVGLISDLPTELIAAFRATLEEIREADLILHVRDIAHPDTESQFHDVLHVLDVLGIRASEDGGSDSSLKDESEGPKVLEVWNKVDLLSPEDQFACRNRAIRARNIVPISVEKQEGLDHLLDRIEQKFSGGADLRTLRIPTVEGKTIHWIYEHCCVLSREQDEDGHWVFQVQVLPEVRDRFYEKFSDRACSFSCTEQDVDSR